MNTPPPPPPPPPPSPERPASGGAGGAAKFWGDFRSWPWWLQALGWLFFLPLLLVVFAWTKPKGARRPWYGAAAASVLLLGVVMATSPADEDQSRIAAGETTSTTAPRSTTTERRPSTTTTLSTTTTEAVEAPEGGYRSASADTVDTSIDDAVDRAGASPADVRLLDSLRVEPEHTSGYDRDLFPHWDDADDDGCDTRCEVLTSQRLDDGSWYSAWDGATETDSSQIHIDHVVALAEAWESGAHAWNPRQRDDFADDRTNLLAVTAASNLRKSAKDAAEWFPSNSDSNCLWARTVVAVKADWDLAVDIPERDALRNLLNTCGGAPATTAAPPPTSPPPTSPPPTAPPATQPPATTAPPTTQASNVVHPGSFCSPAGATGVSKNGVPMTCSTHKCTGEPYDQPRWRKTHC